MKKYKKKIIAGVIVALVLSLVFMWGGNIPGNKSWDEAAPESSGINRIQSQKPTQESPSSTNVQEKEVQEEKISGDDIEYAENNGIEITENVRKNEYQTESVPEEKLVPAELQTAVDSDKELTCVLSVRCDTILDNLLWLDDEKASLVPEDGVIFNETTVTFYEGESVFNILVREMKRNKIHLEFENVPIYNSAYIEGIANIYEFDCGELSGWMYKVNGQFPNYGCSRYKLKEGDRVEWVYTCDSGADVGDYYSTRNGR